MEACEYGRYFNSLEKFRYHPDDDDADADDEEELKKNPEYKYFIENLKPDENGVSYSVELPVGSDSSIVLRYEGTEEESFENVDRQRNFKSNSKGEKAKVPGNSGGFPGKARADVPETVTKSLETGDYGSKKRVAGQKRKRDDMNALGEGAEAKPVSCKSSGGSSKPMICVVKDESEAKHPDSFDKSGMNTELGDEKGHTSTPHKNDESCSEVEIFTLDNMPLLDGGYTPFVSSNCYQLVAAEACGDGIRGSSLSQFREKLMSLLKVPYNRLEFDDLWLKVTKRKPAQGVKESRRGKMRSYSTKPEGKSYLDWHKGLIELDDCFLL
ncbi:hypothetical protein V6N13_054189 [Hibiscus sabdariffa]